MTGTRYIDIHLLHTVPYSNLNRDDLGSPKTVRFGGVDRTRVSSQCWKRAVRLDLEQRSGDVAKRTRRVPLEIARRLRERGWDDELATFAGQQVAAAVGGGLKLEDNGGTAVLLYIPAPVLDELTDICVAHQQELADARAGGGKKKKDSVLPGKQITAAVARRNPVINLFGRMLADVPSSHVDGAVQVAHAFTVHGTSPEVDFFTAVDDVTREADETGSGHMNSAEFSAGTFYRYASVNLADLARNLGGTDGPDERTAVELAGAFVDAFLSAMPGAKKNSTAPFTVPDLAYVAVRDDRPVSLASAFEAPVRSPMDGGYGPRAVDRLDDHADRVYQLLGTGGLIRHAHAGTADKPLAHLGDRVSSYAELVRAAVGEAGSRWPG